MGYITIEANRESYGKEDVRTITVGELIAFLEDHDPDLKIILSHDRGYTYGGIRPELIYEDEPEEDPDPEEVRALNDRIAAEEMEKFENEIGFEGKEG